MTVTNDAHTVAGQIHVLWGDIARATNKNPVAVTIPEGVFPHLDRIWGLPVVRTSRAVPIGLVYGVS